MKFGDSSKPHRKSGGYGAPVVHLHGENSKEGFFTPSRANVGTQRYSANNSLLLGRRASPLS
jgi:hypothetical protein